MKVFGLGIFDLFDVTVTKFLMPLGGLLMTLFVGHYLGKHLVEQQLTNNDHTHVRFMRPLLLLIRWVVPAGIIIIFLKELIPPIIK